MTTNQNQVDDPHPIHKEETKFDGAITFVTDVPGGLPLDSEEVIEREQRRQCAGTEKRTPEANEDREPQG